MVAESTAPSRSMSLTEGGVEEHTDRSVLDANGFVRVCLQLLRDNYLVKVRKHYMKDRV